jgi:hypothetical protein
MSDAPDQILSDPHEPYWQRYRGVSNSPAARAAILVPLIGYWIIFNDSLAHYLTLRIGPSEVAAPTGSPPWRLSLTYFGLVSIAIASAIYQAFCPQEVKKYDSGTDYILAVGSQISRTELERVEHALRTGDEGAQRTLHRLEQQYSYVRMARDEFDRTIEGGLVKGLDRKRESEEFGNYIRELLQAHYDLCNRIARAARWTMKVTYAMGFVLLTIPSINVFCCVLSISLKSLWSFFT